MKITLKQILNSKVAFEDLLKKEIDLKVSYILIKVLNVIECELKNYHTIIDKKITELGTVREDGNYEISPKSPNYSEFIKQDNELKMLEVEIPIDKKVHIKELEPIKISTANLILLNWLIEIQDTPND